MIDAAHLTLLDGILQLESRTFVRYVVEASGAQPGGDFDAKVSALYEEWYRETERHSAAIRDLLEAEGFAPQSGLWPMSFAQYNYATPAHLLAPMVEKMSAHIEAIKARLPGLGGWPRARDLVQAVVDREEHHLRSARELVAARPPATPRPPRVKGTSAARW